VRADRRLDDPDSPSGPRSFRRLLMQRIRLQVMSHGTVKAHLAHAYQKLDVATRVELVTLAREHNSVSSN
jgi:Bacterial regulatory proteins, luxR family